MKSDYRFESNNCIWNRFHMIYLYIEKIKNKLYNFSETSNDKNKYEKSITFEIQKSILR